MLEVEISKNLNKQIYVSFEVEGTHCWPECDIEEVSYLKHKHRHLFKISCTKRVDHSNRDIEFIDFKHQIKKYLRDVYFYDPETDTFDFVSLSCEMIATDLLLKFGLDWCCVTEDGENGAMVSI